VNVKIKKNFKAAIHSNAGGLGWNQFDGGTFTWGGFQDATAQNASITDPHVVKVVVLFTDGYANMIQDTLTTCSAKPLIYGGCTRPEQNAGMCSGVSYFPSDIKNINQKTGGVTCHVSGFPAQDPSLGRNPTASVDNVSQDAMYRTQQLANTLRSQGTTVYAIGLGSFISEPFLNNLANTPTAETFNSSQPQGSVVIAPTAADLDEAFRKIAEQILLRLTQ
jgi:hypothetical protein